MMKNEDKCGLLKSWLYFWQLQTFDETVGAGSSGKAFGAIWALKVRSPVNRNVNSGFVR